MSESIHADPTRTAAPAAAGSTTRNAELPTGPPAPAVTATLPPDPLPRPFGRYQLRQLLGRGGMGSVYLAHDAQLDREVALKIPRPFGDNPTLWRERFLTEARAAATLSHPNICPVHDVGEHDGQPYLTMAYIDGETLSAKLRAAGRLPVAEAVEIVTAVARAMADAHARGIVHRDLKPGNVMIDRRGRPVVMDFGLALRTSQADDMRLTLTGVAMGTPAYMPPEQAGGDVDAIGPPADVYALGVILFELLTGKVPFRGRTFGQLLAQIERDPPPLPSSLNPDIHPALDGIILTALAKAPADRFTTAAELADALDQYQAGDHAALTARYGAALARADTAADHTRPRAVARRPRRGWLVAAGLLGLLVLLAGAIYVSTDKGELKVEFLDPDTGKPIDAPKNIDVKVNGQRVILDPNGRPITVRAGEDQMLVVTGEDFVTESQTFTLKRWKDATVRVSLIPKERLAKRPEAKPDEPKPPKPPVAPPKPVAYPTDKTLIEAGGWQVLADATKEQMQAWLDERKKAKHSVTWLDACEVGGKPVFSAVAVLDDRQTDWTAFLDLSSDTVKDNPALNKHINTKRYHPRSLSGYGGGQGGQSVMLWVPGGREWSIAPFAAASETDGMLRESAADGEEVYLLRPFPVGDAVRGAAYWEVRREGKQPHGYNLTETELATFLAGLDPKVRPRSVAVYPKDGGLRYAVATAHNPNGQVAKVDRGLTADQFRTAAADYAKTGFRPESVTACPWDGSVRYCVVWVKDPPKPTPYPKDKTLIKQGDFETLLDATKEQMQAWLAEKKTASHSVLWLDVVEVAGKPCFSAVAALDNRQTNWTVSWDLAANRVGELEWLAKAIDTKGNYLVSGGCYVSDRDAKAVLLWWPGQRIWAMTAFAIERSLAEDEERFRKENASLRVLRPYPFGDGTSWVACWEIDPSAKSTNARGLSQQGLADYLAAARKDNGVPLTIAGSTVGGVLTFAAVVLPNKSKVEWDSSVGLSAAELKSRAEEQAQKGFRPQSVTAVPWDGAVRYCVVWVKDPPKPTPYPKDKTLVKAGGYETLLDATKEQTQAWLDDKKKAGHSVTRLDVTPVAGRPLYSAVAALDERQPKWVAMLEVPNDEMPTPAMRKKLNTETHVPVSISGYPTGEDVTTALLWVPGTRSWGYRTCNATTATAREELAQAERDGEWVRILRGMPVSDGGVLWGYYFEANPLNKTRCLLDATEAEATAFLASLREDKRRPVGVSAVPTSSGLRFGVASGQLAPASDWQAEWGLTAVTFPAALKTRTASGYRPDTLTAYAWDGAVRYCVVWVKEPAKPPEAKK